MKILKSIPFILPHTLLRAFCFPIIAAFFKHYAFIAFSLLLITNFIIAMSIVRRGRVESSTKIGVAFRVVIFGFCAPATLAPTSESSHTYLKRSLLSTSLFCLLGLLLVLLLPHVIQPDTLGTTAGLGQLHFADVTGFYSHLSNSFFNICVCSAVNSGSRMALSHEMFSAYVFPPLFVLCIYVVIESGCLCIVQML